MSGVNTETGEVWRDVVGFEGYYEVSNLGRVRSLDRIGETRPGLATRFHGRMLKLQVNEGGYRTVQLNRDGNRTRAWVHRLVLSAFVEPQPDPSLIVRHLDGDPSNNVPDNLAWGTHAENALDCIRHGRHPEASKSFCDAGHEFTQSNTRIDHRGARECRECRRSRNKAVAARRSAERRERGLKRYLRATTDEDLVTQVRRAYATTRLTQLEIAAAFGVSQSTVGRWVRGETRPDIAGPVTKRGKGFRAA